MLWSRSTEQVSFKKDAKDYASFAVRPGCAAARFCEEIGMK